jgi:hypothetical protein
MHEVMLERARDVQDHRGVEHELQRAATCSMSVMKSTSFTVKPRASMWSRMKRLTRVVLVVDNQPQSFYLWPSKPVALELRMRHFGKSPQTFFRRLSVPTGTGTGLAAFAPWMSIVVRAIALGLVLSLPVAWTAAHGAEIPPQCSDEGYLSEASVVSMLLAPELIEPLNRALGVYGGLVQRADTVFIYARGPCVIVEFQQERRMLKKVYPSREALLDELQRARDPWLHSWVPSARPYFARHGRGRLAADQEHPRLWGTHTCSS